MNDRENTLNRCKCPDNVRNVVNRSFFMSAPPILGILIDRVQHDGSLNHAPIKVTMKLNVQPLLAGNGDAKSVE